MYSQLCCSARSSSVPRSRARGIPPATGSAATGSPLTAASRQCYNTAADGESLKSVPESFAVGRIQTALPAVAVKGGVGTPYYAIRKICYSSTMCLSSSGIAEARISFYFSSPKILVAPRHVQKYFHKISPSSHLTLSLQAPSFLL